MPDGKVSIDAVFAQGEAWSNPFSDVVEGAWYYEAVAYVCNNGLMNGVGGGYFEPNANLTRAMLVQVLYNLEQKPALDSEAGFTDVAADAWYADAVNWAAQNQVVNGYGGNAFGPEDALTREQMASILYRYATYKGYDTTEGGMAIREFADYESISDVYKRQPWDQSFIFCGRRQ